jgi:hypothetical protein
VETPDGVLQPRAATYYLDSGYFEQKIETLMWFHRRYMQDEGTKDYLIAAVDGKLYQKPEILGPWNEIDMPAGKLSFGSNVWSWIAYEMNFDGSEYPVDVLVISNATDGMYVIVPSDISRIWGVVKKLTWGSLDEETWEAQFAGRWMIIPVDTKGNKFSVIERYNERVWGGGIPDDDDKLVYSRPYDPTNWNAAGEDEEPEDGAGDIRLPSWDGDRFTTLKAFGDNLIAFKKHRLWRITGTNPGEFNIHEQYGGGAPYPDTVETYGEKMLIADRYGMSVYDGMTVSDYMREYVQETWKNATWGMLDQMCAEIFREKYYLAFPMGLSAVNNALLIYDLKTGTILLHKDIYIESMMATERFLYATSSQAPGRVMVIPYNSWDIGLACGDATRWESPWMDFGRKDIQKGGFDLYFIPEVQQEAVTLSISIQTEKKLKTKEYTIQPLTEEQRAAEKEHRGKRLHFGGNGRRFRVIIESAEGVTAPWRLIGGVHVIVETDPD